MESFPKILVESREEDYFESHQKDWGLCIAYYIMFLGTLSALFAAMMYIALANISQMDTPWYQLEMSIIGASPGLGFWPAVRLSSPLIWYKWNEREMTYHTYVTKINSIFDGYRPYNPDIYKHCYEGYKSNESDKLCFFNLETLGRCYEPQYGYDTQMPCVYLTLNQVYRWEPRCYSWDTLPSNFPEYLKEYISEKHSKETESNHVWVSCTGVHEADSQHMGDISFHPYPGFPAEFYPYLHQDGYMSPLVAIKFNNPALDMLISVRCQAWAHNIEQDVEKGGSVEFQLMIGSKSKKKRSYPRMKDTDESGETRPRGNLSVTQPEIGKSWL